MGYRQQGGFQRLLSYFLRSSFSHPDHYHDISCQRCHAFLGVFILKQEKSLWSLLGTTALGASKQSCTHFHHFRVNARRRLDLLRTDHLSTVLIFVLWIPVGLIDFFLVVYLDLLLCHESTTFLISMCCGVSLVLFIFDSIMVFLCLSMKSFHVHMYKLDKREPIL